MTHTTKAQRLAIKQVYDRTPLENEKNYRSFRSKAYVIFGFGGAIGIPWKGMHLCIEPDGYTHS